MTEATLSVATGVRILTQLGLEPKVLSHDRIRLAGEELRVSLRTKTPSPAAAAQSLSRPTLLLVPHLTPGLRELAAKTENLTIVGLSSSEVWRVGKQLSGPAEKDGPRPVGAKVPWAKFGLMRSLARTARPRTQAEFAQELGITQAAVSQAMSSLSHLVEKTRRGWKAKEFGAVANEFLATYPGPGGYEQPWYGLDAVIPQGEKVAKAFYGVLLSADSAADEIAPYRRARTSVVYSERGLDLDAIGFVPSEKSRATLLERVPADRTIFQLAKAGNTAGLADGLLVAYDLQNAAGTDAELAKNELLKELQRKWIQIDN